MGIVTGATSGIGKETARELAKRGAKVSYRAMENEPIGNESKGKGAIKELCSNVKHNSRSIKKLLRD